jgi:tetratricopeptide (TPR) repeat protein
VILAKKRGSHPPFFNDNKGWSLKGEQYPYRYKTVTVLLLLVLLVLPIYHNTFHASWQFDDKPNIVGNARLHIDDVSPGTLWQAFFEAPGKHAFYRPIPNLSFALNWYFAKDDTYGYHLVNTCIHILTAFLLFLATRLLLRTPKVRPFYSDDDIHFIALLNAALWAINPIQIQAVTYIVQRMASMAAMFYILGIYWYLKARLGNHKKRQTLFFGGCLLSFALAVMSKENAVILPLSLVLIESIFFLDVSLKKIKQYLPLLLVLCLLFVAAVAVFVLKTGFLFITEGYDTRPFTLGERLLTQPRVLLFYLSQIFYPLPGRLSITHDMVVSKSLLSPWTTLPAILAVFLMIVFAFRQIRPRPLVAFAVLFFFLNHVVESSFIALEMIFEHRNYLPSFFLFLPIASGLRYLFNLYNKHNRFIYVLISLFLIFTLIGWGCFTYIRNQAWRTETSLWRDAMKKAPKDARPISNLAIQLAWGEDPSPLDYEVALTLFERALRLNKARNFLDQEIIGNIGSVHFQRGEYLKAIQFYEDALQINPFYLKARQNLTNSLVMLGKWDEASAQADLLINNPQKHVKSDYFNLKGLILLLQNRPEDALPYLQKARKMEQNNMAAVLLNTGVALSLTGKYDNADVLLNRAAMIAPEEIRTVYALIENSIRAGNSQKSEKYVEQMFEKFSIQTIVDGVNILNLNYRTPPMAPELIIPAVKKKMVQFSADMAKLTLPCGNE